MFKFMFPSPCPSTPMTQTLSHKDNFYTEHQIVINCHNIIQIFILGSGLVTLLWRSYLHLCSHVSYVAFNTNLNLYNKKKTIRSPQCFWALLSLILLGLLLSECGKEQILLLIIHTNPNFGSVVNLALKFSKIISWTIFCTLLIYMFSISVSTPACVLCLMMFQIWCHAYTNNVPHWLPIILIMLSNNINLNPGPHFQNNFFNFINLNVNSLVKDNF